MKELLTCEGLTKSYQKGTNALDTVSYTHLAADAEFRVCECFHVGTTSI